MANPILGTAFASVASVSANSANTSHPVASVLDPNHPFRVYKATGATTSEYIQFDFGAVTSVVAVFVDNTNVDTLDFQFDSDVNFAPTPPENETDEAVSQDEIDGRYKVYFTPANSPVSYQYMRIKFGTSASVQDGQSVWQVGGVTVITTARTLDQPIGYPYVATSVTPTMATGGQQPVAVGNRFAVIQVAQSVMSDTAAAKTDLTTLLGSLSMADPAVLFLNRSDTSEAYRVYRQNIVGLREAGPAHYSVPTITLREVGD